jgi:predicted metal-binding membrane protein
VAQITIILLGLILIVAGLFQFKEVRQVAQVAAA